MIDNFCCYQHVNIKFTAPYSLLVRKNKNRKKAHAHSTVWHNLLIHTKRQMENDGRNEQITLKTYLKKKIEKIFTKWTFTAIVIMTCTNGCRQLSLI